MNNVDTSSWLFFKISDIFNVEKSKNYTIEQVMEMEGNDIPYITRTDNNNGVKVFVDRKQIHKLEKGNCIIIGGEGATVFYQPQDFISGNNITKIYNKNLNENNALFIVSILKLEKYRYSYSRAFNKLCVQNTLIKLPAKDLKTPDWEFMENYIKDIKERERESRELAQSLISAKLKFDVNKWRYFMIEDIFKIIKVGKYSSAPDVVGKTKFISSTSQNNGVSCMVDVKPNIQGNVITVSTNGSSFDCFYHDYPIVVSTDVVVLYNTKLNKYNSLFICAILQLEKIKFSYGRKAKNNLVNKTKIKLPIDSMHDPDWEFMENYIKSLPYSKYL